MKPKPWWQSYPKALWNASDWREARRRGVAPPELPSLDPTAQQGQAGGGISWGPPPSKSDARRREADRALEKAWLRPRRW